MKEWDMHLKAYDRYRDAWRRGLMSDAEFTAYQLMIDTRPESWKGWVTFLGLNPQYWRKR